MNDSTQQITIRGIDFSTKQKLTKLAAQRGVSLNSLVVDALQRTAGTTTLEQRIQQIHKVLDMHRIASSDIDSAQKAIAQMDKVSKAKQKQEENDFSI